MSPRASLCALPAHHDLDGVDQDGEVEDEREMLHVIEVVAELFERVLDRRAVAVADLCPPGDAGFDRMPHHVKRNLAGELLDEEWTLGPGPDEAHLAAEHVPELGQLVEARQPDEPA